jgi:hypothetical protein
MALASTRATAPTPDAQDPAPLDLHDLYRHQEACGYTRALTLSAHQVQTLMGRLRGIHAINAVLIASSDDISLQLSQWLQNGLIEAANAIAWSMANDLESIDKQARKEQLQ